MNLVSIAFIIFIFINLNECVNHWTFKDGQITPKVDSPFYMRDCEDLSAFLDQIQLNDYIESSYNDLLRKRDDFAEHLSFSMQFGEALLEQAKCAMDTYILEKKMSYLKINPQYLKRLELSSNLDSSDVHGFEDNEPYCSNYLRIHINNGEYDYLESLKPEIVKSTQMVSEEDNKNPGGTDLVRRLAIQGLKQDSNSWKFHTLGSYYWRLKGNAAQALECARIGLALAPVNRKDIPMLSLGTILFRMNRLADSVTVLSKAAVLAPNIAENHLVLATALAAKHDFERSIFHFDEAEQLDPSILRRTHQVRTFINCLQSFNNKASKMYSYVEYMKNEVKEFKKLKKHIMRMYEKIVQQQLPLSARYQNTKVLNNDLHKRGQFCSTRTSVVTGEATLFCDFYSDMQMRLESKNLDIESLEREFKSKTETILRPVSQLKSWKTQIVPMLPSDTGTK